MDLTLMRLIDEHENPRDAVKPGAADYEYRFPGQNCLGYLCEYAAAPVFMSPFSGAAISFEKTAASVIIGVARKPRGI